MKLEDEIKQQDFVNAQQKAAMNAIFTGNWLTNQYAAALKTLDLSLQQLNVLTILKGQKNHVGSVNLIKDRLIDRMPNVSRLLNKLMEKGLIVKDRSTSDQRVVYIRLTPKGLEYAEQGRKLFQSVSFNISNEKSALLNDLLNEMRT
jgi:DNA-binding MarR family transcriptional regulator